VTGRSPGLSLLYPARAEIVPAQLSYFGVEPFVKKLSGSAFVRRVNRLSSFGEGIERIQQDD
jgi:hypothetical protein